MTDEAGRQAAHMLGGLAAVAFGFVFGKDALVAALLAAMAGGLVLVQLLASGRSVPLASWVIRNWERKGAVPGLVSLHYLAGLLLVLTLSSNFYFSLAVIGIIAVGDGVSTVVGLRFGRNRLHWHRSKTWEGSAAFFLGSVIAAFPFIGAKAVFLSAAMALAETLPVDLDDNILLAIAALVFKAVAGW